MRKYFFPANFFLTVWLFLAAAAPGYAQEIVIVYTGSTHAMIYPCDCPNAPDGGVARRAALVKQLRKKYPGLLLLDSGSFVAGGQKDRYSQNTQLDTLRTLINLKAMEMMRYDAAAIGPDEFNFGADFLEENIAKSKINFLSTNIIAPAGKLGALKPYAIKEAGGVKVGILAITHPAVTQKAAQISIKETKAALSASIEELRKQGAALILLLSSLSDSDNAVLAEDLKGIDVIIAIYGRGAPIANRVKGGVVVLTPAAEGRSLSKVVLKVEAGKVKDYSFEDTRLSDKVQDDPEMRSILPECFSDANCSKTGFIGTCRGPGTQGASCNFEKAEKVSLQVISIKDCVGCDPEPLVKYLKTLMPGLEVSYLYYPDKKAEKLLKETGMDTLPLYLFDRNIEKDEKVFTALVNDLTEKGDFYVVNPVMGGISYYLGREKIKGRLDLFLKLSDKDSASWLEVSKEFNPRVHFLANLQNGKFFAPGGNLELEEYLRCACVQKYYPEYFYDYLTCRAANMNSSWWEDCMGGLAADRIKICAKGQQGMDLLKENIDLNAQLKVMASPVYLLDNQQIFGTTGKPKKEDLKKILKR